MGGNVFKDVVRLSRLDFDNISQQFTDYLTNNYSKCFDYNYIVPSFFNKQTFGDLDILIVVDSYQPLFEKIIQSTHFETSQNSNVLSINYNNFQIDLIAQPREYALFSLHYYSFNDLGNLIGRISHKMGFKFGHDGLTYILRDSEKDTQVISEIKVTLNFFEAIHFLGFDTKKFTNGFFDLIDIFNYVISSNFFNADLYPLEHRNHIARVRDRKRKTYMEFLKYIYGKEFPNYVFVDKQFYLQKAFIAFPDFKERFVIANNEYEQQRILKSKINGHIVSDITGLVKDDLGIFMKNYVTPYIKNNKHSIINMSEQDLKDIILGFFHEST